MMPQHVPVQSIGVSQWNGLSAAQERATTHRGFLLRVKQRGWPWTGSTRMPHIVNALYFINKVTSACD